MSLFPKTVFVCSIGVLLSAAAHAQVHRIAFTTDDDDDFGAYNSDAGVSVNDSGVVSTTNMSMSLFDRNGTLLDSRTVADLNAMSSTFWPFYRVDTTDGSGSNELLSRMFDPQTVYHTQTGRLWILYSEHNFVDGTFVYGSGDNNISAIHLAVSQEMTGSDELDTFNDDEDDDWWYYTGDSTTSVGIGNGGTYFDLAQGMEAYFQGGTHATFSTTASGIVDKPHMAVDEQAVYITVNGKDVDPMVGPPGTVFNAVVIIPLSHGTSGTLSILDGDKPDPTDQTFIRNTDLPFPDNHTRHYTVQEPYEDDDFENAQFILSVTNSSMENTIRLGGLWFETLPPPAESGWRYSQRLKPDGTILEDMTVNVGGTFTFAGGASYQPTTPDSAFSPRVAGATSFIPSAVLVRDANDEPRIFAAHHVRPVTSSGVGTQWVVQWYVIDPHLEKFRSTTGSFPSTEWQPEVVVTGRIDSAGDRYHPVIGVTEQGVAYIEYTYSSNTVWPEVRRVTLNNSYTDIVTSSEVTVQTGPTYRYEGALNGWADFADMQADPVNGCAFWSVHTLVYDNGPSIDPVSTNSRDIWLFETQFECGNSNLNFDGGTDLYDMAMFNDLFLQGARRVDMNIDGTTDSTDAALYQDAYDAATSP